MKHTIKSGVKMHNIFSSKNTYKSLLTAVACLSLTACLQTSKPLVNPADLSQPQFKINHPITVKEGMQEIDLDLPPKALGLLPGQIAVSAQFILDYMDKGEGHFEIWQPRGHTNKKAIKAAYKKVHEILYDAAIPTTAVIYHKYDAYGQSAPLGLKFKRYYATTHKCGHFPSDLGENFQNKNYKNFGCAYQNNIAAMISNPKDLLGPANMSASSAERRQIIWAKYIQGAPTGAVRSSEEKVSISKVATK